MVEAPSRRATRPMDTAARPSSAATAMPAATMAPSVRPGRGPRVERARRPQAAAMLAGSPRTASSSGSGLTASANVRTPYAMNLRTTYAVEVDGLHKRYGDLPVLCDVGFTVPPGMVHAVLGPNGAGKTTTVRILATLLRPDAGTVRVMGLDAVADRRAVQRRISLTGQYAADDGLLTGVETLRMVGRLAGLRAADARARAGELLERFDLLDAARRRAGTYSGGLRRRLDLAASLVSRPDVLFLDEPTTGLDPRSRQVMWDVVGGLVADGVTVLLTTQYLEEADRLADQIVLLDG